MNGDQLDDLLIPTWPSTALGAPIILEIWLNNGANGFYPAGQIVGPNDCYLSGMGDFNGDAVSDLLFYRHGVPAGQPSPPAPNEHLVAAGLGGGTFATSVSIQPLCSPTADFEPALIADIDSDGYDDFVQQYGDPSTGLPIQICYGGPSFSFFSTSSVGQNQYRSTLVDIDGDGTKDLYQSALGPNLVAPPNQYSQFATVAAVQRGRPNRTWVGNAHAFATSNTGLWCNATPLDFDGDGDMDFVGLPRYTGIYQLRLPFFHTSRVNSPGGCVGTNGKPILQYGTLIYGSNAFAFDVYNALPSATAAIIVSRSRHQLTGCGIVPVLSTADLLLPMGGLGFLSTNALGYATLPLTIPAPYIGQTWDSVFYAQAAVLDPNGAYQVAPGINLALSDPRTLFLTTSY